MPPFRSAANRLRPHVARAGWALSEALVGPLLLLVLSPWLLRTLGQEGFGLWALAVSISSLGHLASLGVGLTITRHVAVDLAADRPHQALAVTRAGLSVALALATVILLAGGAATPWIAGRFFGKMGPAQTVSFALMIALWLLVVQEVDNVFSGALRGAGRFDVVAKIELVGRPLWALGVGWVALRTGDVNATLLTGLALNALRLLARAVGASARLAGCCICPAFDLYEIRRMVRFGGWVWTQGIGTVMVAVVDRLLVGAWFGAADLARYTLCLQLSQVVHSLQSAAVQTIVPWVSGRDADPARSGFRRLKQLALFGGVACLATPLLLAGASGFALTLWLGPTFADDNHGLLLLLMGGVALLSLSMPAYFVLVGLGDVRFVGLLAVGAGVLALTTSALLSGWTSLGVASFAIGRAVYGMLLGAAYFSRLWRLGEGASTPPPGRS